MKAKKKADKVPQMHRQGKPRVKAWARELSCGHTFRRDTTAARPERRFPQTRTPNRRSFSPRSVYEIIKVSAAKKRKPYAEFCQNASQISISPLVIQRRIWYNQFGGYYGYFQCFTLPAELQSNRSTTKANTQCQSNYELHRSR